MTERQKELVEKNVGLAGHVARKFSHTTLEYEDLISAANYGLVKAAATYDAGKNTRFSTWAVPIMQNEIRMELRKEIRNRNRKPVSLDATVYEDNGCATLKDFIPDPQRCDETAEFLYTVKENFNSLKPKEQEILLYAVENPGKTQIDYASHFDISQSYYSILIRGIRKKLIEE